MVQRLLILAGLCFLSFAEGEEEVFQWKSQVLKPVFHPDKIYRFVSTTDVTLSPPDEVARQVRIEQQARFDTSLRSDGLKGVAMKARTERLQINIQRGEDRVAYDSLAKGGEADKIHQHFESMVNRYIKMELDGKMRVSSHAEGGRIGPSTPLPNLPSFGPEELLQLVNLIPQGFSAESVSIGDKWYQNGKRLFGELGEMDYGVTYQLTGMAKEGEAPCAVIEFHGQLTGDIQEEKRGAINFQNTQISGRLLFDPKLKMTRLAEHTLVMTANVPKQQQTYWVPIYQKVSIRLLSVK